jgi:hypothetical protein
LRSISPASTAYQLANRSLDGGERLQAHARPGRRTLAAAVHAGARCPPAGRVDGKSVRPSSPAPCTVLRCGETAGSAGSRRNGLRGIEVLLHLRNRQRSVFRSPDFPGVPPPLSQSLAFQRG